MAQSKVLVELIVVNNGKTTNPPSIRYFFDAESDETVAELHTYVIEELRERCGELVPVETTVYDADFGEYASASQADPLRNMQRYRLKLQAGGGPGNDEISDAAPKDATTTAGEV